MASYHSPFVSTDEAQRREHEIRVDNPHPYQSDEWFVHNQVCELKDIITNGLNPVYDSIDDYWYDFWPNFSWQPGRQHAQVRLLLGHPEFESLEAQVQQKFDVSLREELVRDQWDQSFMPQ